MTNTTGLNSKYGIPIAIIVAGVLIMGAIFLSRNSINNYSGDVTNKVIDFRLPNESDHIRGNVDAKVSIIEFSDFQCPYCAQLHITLKNIIEQRNDVKWIYRHFPLSSHSKAFEAAVASECIAKLGGNESFWNFVDTAFTNQKSVGDDLYEEIAISNNIDIEAFRLCTEEKNISDIVSADLDEALASGGRGTPFSIVITVAGKQLPFSGALNFDQINNLVDQALLN